MIKLLVVWKSDDYRNIEYFLSPFTLNSKKQKWFEDVEVLIWGAATDYCRENEDAQAVIKNMLSLDIEVRACKYCAEKVQADVVLENLGVNVMYTGVYLSDKMKNPEYEVITI